MRKHFQEILENVLKHEKYSKNSRKIPRYRLGHESIQIKYLELMKKILKPSNK
jgi:hypothetical protein